MKIYDLIIIGSGPAGLTAAIYAARYALRTLVVGSSFGGQVSESGRVDNYPGFIEMQGLDLMKRMADQAKSFGVEVLRCEVSEVKQVGDNFEVAANGERFSSRGLIVATGVKPRKLGVPGEDTLFGKGVSYCALCDAPLYKDKVVAMIGGGDSAVDGALELCEHVEKVYLIHRREEFRAKPGFVEKAKNHPKIEMIVNTNVVQIKGEDFVTGVVLDKAFQGQTELEVQGAFIEIGNEPDRKLTKDIGLAVDESGYVKVGLDMSTNIPGLFAAGDITNSMNGMKQIVTACAGGAIAAQSVYRYLGGMNTPKSEMAWPQATRSSGGAQGGGGGDKVSSAKSLVVDKSVCIGCGLCTTIAENTFALGEDGKAAVKDPTGDTAEKIQDAVDSCPVKAIRLS